MKKQSKRRAPDSLVTPVFRKPPLGVPHAIDVHVGSRVRLRRTLVGMSQEKLGAAVGLTFQQIQKYERGANRIGASRLYELSHILDVPVSFFFDDMSSQIQAAYSGDGKGFSESSQANVEADPMGRRETLELVRSYYNIRDLQVRRRLFDLAKSLANADFENVSENSVGNTADG